MYTDSIEIEWDPFKNSRNQAKHGLSFEDAILVFRGETVIVLDDRYDYGEVRYSVFGELGGRGIVVTYTNRASRIRIISMRRTNNREKKYYQKRLEENRRHEGRGY